MKSSLFLAATSAVLASAGPVEKRFIKTEVVTDFVVVTITAQAPQETGPPPAVYVNVAAPQPETTPEPVYVPAPAPPPEPTTYAPPPPAANPAQQAPAPSTDYGNYEQTMLEQHNVHRRNHSAGDLTWDATLAQYALNTANTCKFAHDMNQGGGGYGQNLASWGGTGSLEGTRVKTAASGVTNQWYNGEMELFQGLYGQSEPSSMSGFEGWGHFTQLVWKDTTKVGCATVQCAPGTVLSFQSWYTVCNYNPPGNFAGQYGSNVLRPLGQSSIVV